MKKSYLAVGVICFFGVSVFAQTNGSNNQLEIDTKKVETKAVPAEKIERPASVNPLQPDKKFDGKKLSENNIELPVDFPKFTDTGHPEADRADYKLRKTQWILDNPQRYALLKGSANASNSSSVPSTTLIPTKVTQ